MKKELEQRYSNLLGGLHKLEITDFTKVENMLKKDVEFDHLIKKLPSSYEPKGGNIEEKEKIGMGLSIAKGYIKKGEGILSKNMGGGLTTYEMALGYIKDAGEEIKKDKQKYDSSELNKRKEELANFSEALSRKIKMDVEKKDNEYSLKKDLSDKEKNNFKDYKQELRVKALKLAEEAVEYARELTKD